MAKKSATFSFIQVAYLISALGLVSCIPTNLRIQVNNENLSNAPYLLEAIKQIDNPIQVKNDSSSVVTEHASPSASSASIATTTTAGSTPKSDNRVEPATNSPSLPTSNRTAEEDYEETDPNSFSVIKEETIEEIVDLDPETASKLTPPENGSAESEHTNIADLASAENPSSTDGREGMSSESDKIMEPNGSVAPKHDRKPQLPVTSSHLKKPAYGALDDELEASSSHRVVNETVAGSGAKSLVSPSVLADDLPSGQKIIKKMPTSYPDTLEPAQIMNGVTNVSAVPGIVNKEYGHQTRTRITLGGGYVRDRLPPLVNPASDTYVDNRPEKPVTPLEKTRPLTQTGSTTINSEKREIEDDNSSVLNEGVEKDDNDSSQNTTLRLGQQDSRCPKEGTLTLEHPTACDKYFYCENGYITEYTCPNGLMYGTRDIVRDYCVHRWKADCQDKSVPNPISSPGCRWQYGIFNVQGSPKCSPDYYECAAGKFEVKKCSVDGQIYDDRTKSCRYAEQAGCANEALANFQCPPDDQANTYWPFPRYFLNERALIHCVNDKPEIVRCIDTERVDPEHLHCIPIAKQQNGPPSVNLGTRKARERKKSTN